LTGYLIISSNSVKQKRKLQTDCLLFQIKKESTIDNRGSDAFLRRGALLL
jgi:hypothetical protein